tara:strand:- start:460 stop:990 length:531 start_codon:yes stop_codon:yes gene_type:complete
LKLKKLIVLNIFFTFFFISSIYANSIAVINITEIIKNNDNFQQMLKQIDQNKIKELELLNEQKKSLEILQKKIETDKLILDQNELQEIINDYNLKIDNYNNDVKNIENKFNDLINNNKKKIIDEIIKEVKKIAEINKIDLILTETNYFMVADSINITNDLIEIINNNNMVFKINYN